MRKLAKPVIALAAMVPLTACETAGVLTVLASCEIGTYTQQRKGDRLTEETAADMERNNESRKAAGCPEPPKKS